MTAQAAVETTLKLGVIYVVSLPTLVDDYWRAYAPVLARSIDDDSWSAVSGAYATGILPARRQVEVQQAGLLRDNDRVSFESSLASIMLGGDALR